MRRLLPFLGIGILIVLAGVLFIFCSAKYPEGLYAELVTSKGTIVLLLEHEKTPLTVVNFVGLAEGTLENDVFPLGRHFYNGSRFHRVAPGHVIQGGSPDEESLSGSGYTFPNEIHPDLSHDKAGALGMANGGPHTNSSQFYITLGDRSYLDGDYTVFGNVYAGMDVVNRIVMGDVLESVRIVRAGKKAEAFTADTATFAQLFDIVRQNVEENAAAKRITEDEFTQANWPDALSAASGLKYVVSNAGTGNKLKPGDEVQISYTGRLINGISFVSSEENGKPMSGEEPEIFIYKVGASSINPGFDEAVADMKPGEKRILIMPAQLGYGLTGFYAKEIPGEKRFVISPDSTLIYEVEIKVSRL